MFAGSNINNSNLFAKNSNNTNINNAGLQAQQT